MEAQRAELEVAIDDLRQQMSWAEATVLARRGVASAAE